MPNIDLPIIGQLVHPSIGVLSIANVGAFGPGPVDGTLNPPQGPLALTYGLRISVISRPAGWSRKLGNPDVFNPPFLQLASAYDVLGGGTRIFTQVEWINIDGTNYFWEEALPVEVLYHIEPGWTLNFQWLQT